MSEYLLVRVQPRASRNRIAVEAEGVKVYTTAPPVDGEANEAVIEMVSKALKIAKSRVEITAGHTGRNKRVVVTGMTPIEIIAQLCALPGNV